MYRSFCEFRIRPLLIVFILIVSALVAMLEGIGFSLLLTIASFFKNDESLSQHEPEGIAGIVVKAITDAGIEPTLLLLVGAIVLMALFRQLVIYLKAVSIAQAVRVATWQLQSESLDHLFQAGVQLFITGHRGNFANVIFREGTIASTLVSSGLGMLFNGLLLTGLVVLLLLISWGLTLVSIPIFGLLYLIVKVFSRYSYNVGRAVKTETAGIFAEADEAIRGIVPIKMRCAEDDFRARLKQSIDTWAGLDFAFSNAKALSDSIVPLIFVLCVSYILYVSGNWFDMAFADVGLFLVVLFRLQGAVIQYSSERVLFERHQANLEHIHEFRTQAKASVILDKGSQDLAFEKEICFDNVYFSYGKKHPALNGLSLSIPKGEVVAFAGRSGSGKSTIVNLLCKNIIQDSGTVSVDGELLENISTRSLRLAVGLVSQNIFLFHGTIRYNLTFGLKTPPTDLEIWEILRQSHVDEFVEEIGGLDTVLHENGEDLSGGQRQRLAFARALCQRPDILILDEPTSALDPEAERAIQEGINSLPQGTTVIVVAHRLESIRKASRIYIIDQGRVIETGTHSQLIAAGGAYHMMFNGDSITI